jgi:hypothetical protein
MMRFLKRVEPDDVSEQWAVVTLAGPATDAILRASKLPVPEPGRAIAVPGGGFARGMPAAGRAVDLIVAHDDKAAVVATLLDAGACPVGTWAYEALRVSSRRPRLRFETDHRTIPHEVGWIGSAVHLDKGCYRGQETVARVHNLGRPPRRLVLVHLAGETDVLPAPGAPIEHQGRTVGFLGTAAQHHELGPIALAVIKRSLSDDTELLVDGHLLAIDGDS